MWKKSHTWHIILSYKFPLILFLGYLVSSLFLSEDHELIVLLINTLQKVCVILNLTCSMLRTLFLCLGWTLQSAWKKKLKSKGCMLEKTSKKWSLDKYCLSCNNSTSLHQDFTCERLSQLSCFENRACKKFMAWREGIQNPWPLDSCTTGTVLLPLTSQTSLLVKCCWSLLGICNISTW